MQKRSAFVGVMAVTASLVSAGIGCSALGRASFQNPIVHLRNVQVRGIGLNGGSLDVQSKLGVGTTFTISLPAINNDGEPRA